jgi:lipoprotein-anchoring transpeptidase ErfK/SrfK
MKLRAVTLAALAAAGAASVPAEAAAVRPTQELAALTAGHRVMAAPGVHSHRIAGLRAWRPITGGPTVLPVVNRATTPDGVRWLRVRIPGRPNGTKGWIRKRGTTSIVTSWQVVVSRSTRRVLVYRHGRLVRAFAAIVGKPSTPTPRGHFFVEESVRMLPGHPGGPFALALSARSNVLQEFEGGPGQIAIHGVENLGGTLGTAASHGCVRVSNRSVRWLASRISPGVPVTIR